MIPPRRYKHGGHPSLRAPNVRLLVAALTGSVIQEQVDCVRDLRRATTMWIPYIEPPNGGRQAIYTAKWRKAVQQAGIKLD
jgi:hypothetical protein